MNAYKFEYIWLDGYQPEANLRSKTKIISFESFNKDISKLPDWSFDGSSTMQAEGSSSDCVLKPVAIYDDPARINAFWFFAKFTMLMELPITLIQDQKFQKVMMIFGLDLNKNIH